MINEDILTNALMWVLDKVDYAEEHDGEVSQEQVNDMIDCTAITMQVSAEALKTEYYNFINN